MPRMSPHSYPYVLQRIVTASTIYSTTTLTILNSLSSHQWRSGRNAMNGIEKNNITISIIRFLRMYFIQSAKYIIYRAPTRTHRPSYVNWEMEKRFSVCVCVCLNVTFTRIVYRIIHSYIYDSDTGKREDVMRFAKLRRRKEEIKTPIGK